MDIFSAFSNPSQVIALFVKLFGIVLGFLYIFYSLIVVRQVMVMKKEVSFNDSGLILTIAYVQLFLAMVIAIFALFL